MRRIESAAAASVSSHTARPRALKGLSTVKDGRRVICFIPYGSTESTERNVSLLMEIFPASFHPIRLDREH